MLGEITHLQPIVDDLTLLTEDPHKLPPASEQVRADNDSTDAAATLIIWHAQMGRLFWSKSNPLCVITVPSFNEAVDSILL